MESTGVMGEIEQRHRDRGINSFNMAFILR